MKLSHLRIAAVALALASGAWLSSSMPAPLGDKVEYSFREAPINALGIKGLADLRGKPVVIDFWGKN